ncbi:hypothetical protein [Clostridium sp.]|jgi:hypothetical protein|uniref:hypothetical protein n=1 Tax=Clostridium sp. TaxID=1506 RepID=UPI0025DBE9BB|nr:hypothetical protein [Clostridium sp.]MDY6228532.1 hypothetical protein [Clostridium sp.]
MINKSKIKKISISSNCNNIFKECSNLIYRIPVFLSHPSKLNSKQREFVEIIIKEIRKALFFPRTLPNTEQYPETPLTNIRRMILSSYGFIALDLAQIEVRTLQNNLRQSIDSTTWEGSPFAQIEPAMAYQFGLPMLLIRESTVEKIGIWSYGITPFLLLEWNPNLPLSDFFNSSAWLEIFQNWISQVRNGYYLQTQPQFKYTCTKDSLN